jgi:hypothetical protein
MNIEPGDETITLREAVDTVLSLSAWLRRAGDVSLGHKDDGGVEIADLPNAARAGRTLLLLMHTAGMA